MNPQKIAFIICVNNEVYFEECCWYLNKLVIPEGFETDIISIREANSMTEAYNAAMNSTDAKYKVYMHQDVFINNQNFIADIVSIFQSDEKIGMLGLVGGVQLPKNGIVYNAWNCGRTIVYSWSRAVDLCYSQRKPYISVEALDGMLLATQYDINWRDDILHKWDFYDVAQSFEFLKAGYKLVIPFQDTAWTVHDCGDSNLAYYDESRKIMFESYPEIFTEKWEEYPFNYGYELQTLTKRIYYEIQVLIDQGKYQEAEVLLDGFEENGMDKKTLLLRHIFEIYKMERDSYIRPHIFEKEFSTEGLLGRYVRIEFFLRRIEIGEVVKAEEILKWIHVNKITPVEVMKVAMYHLISWKYVLELAVKAYRLENDIKSVSIIESAFNGRIEEGITTEGGKLSNKCKEAEYWTNYKEDEGRTRWWQSPAIIRHYNKTICGKEIDGWNAGPVKLLDEKRLIPLGGFGKAISIGCGNAMKEISLIKEGIVKYFTCVDIAEGMIERAIRNAKENNVESQIEFICGDIYSILDRKENYDFVFWDNSLHHMEDAYKAVEISLALLKRGGLFFCNDFIGNKRFQWSDMQMVIVNGIRLYLTDNYFKSTNGNMFRKYLVAPPIENMLMIDPSEAADSENIIPAVKKYFKQPQIINTGGLVYHLCLENILRNMPEDSEILKYMLSLDDQTIDFGLSLYAFIYAIK